MHMSKFAVLVNGVIVLFICLEVMTVYVLLHIMNQLMLKQIKVPAEEEANSAILHD